MLVGIGNLALTFCGLHPEQADGGPTLEEGLALQPRPLGQPRLRCRRGLSETDDYRLTG